MFASAPGYQDWRGRAYLDADNPVVRVSLVAEPSRSAYEPEMVLIKGGCYQMGSRASESGRADHERPHRVCIDDVYASTTETTVGQFRAFVDASGYNMEAQSCRTTENWSIGWRKRSWRDPSFKQGDDMPVVCVSWNDAQAYLQWLRDETGKHYRLPTEAEWEYAARGGTSTVRYWEPSSDEACKFANVADERANQQYGGSRKHECNDGNVQTAVVGSYQPNDYGLYDMLGNVWEWTCSEWDADYGGAESRCIAHEDGLRSMAGGSWLATPSWVRAGSRLWGRATKAYFTTGFRIFQDVK